MPLRRLHACLFLAVFIANAAGIRAQDSNGTEGASQKVNPEPALVRSAGLKFHVGSVLIHSRDLRPIEDSYPLGVELDFAWHKISQKAWESCMCYPKMGVALTYWDYDNPDVLGQGITGLFYIEPYFNTRGRVYYSVRMGLGLSYQNSPYDPIENPDNLSYSTYLAFPLQLGGSVHYRVAPRWTLDATLVYNHFSNGGVRKPNKGINWPSLGLGASYYLEGFEFKRRAEVDWRKNGPPQRRLDFTYFLSYEEPRDNLFVFSPGLEVKWSRQFARLNAYTLGGEFMYDNGTGYVLDQEGDDTTPLKAGIAVGHEFLLGKFLFSQQFGAYLYNPNPEHPDVYQRYGLVYRINRRFSTGISLKAHGHVANFLDARIGFSL